MSSHRFACFRWFKWKDISFQNGHWTAIQSLQLQDTKCYMNYLHGTIDNSVNLVAYNKKIKQLGTCTLHVSCGPNMRMVKFFIVDSKLNPIIGLDDSHQLQLIKFNCPIHQSWTGQKSTNLNSFDSISDNPHSTIPTTLTKDWIVNHP